MIDLIVFIAGSIIILSISRTSLTAPGTYQFYRTIVWEIILVMFTINRNTWFMDPFTWNQWLSWILLVVSIILLFEGIYFLRKFGKSKDPVEMTTELVIKGIYKHIRHPLYSSLLFLSWGIFFKSPSILDLVLTVLSTLFLIATTSADEKISIDKFGDDYRTYMKSTKRFIPHLF